MHDRREWEVNRDREDEESFEFEYGIGEENWLKDLSWGRVRAPWAWFGLSSSAIRICRLPWVDSGLIIAKERLLNSCRSFSLT